MSDFPLTLKTVESFIDAGASLHLQTMLGDRAPVRSLIAKIERELLDNTASVILCRYSDEPRNYVADTTCGRAPPDHTDRLFSGDRYSLMESRVEWPRADTQCNRGDGASVSLKKYSESTLRILAILLSQAAPILVTPSSQASTCAKETPKAWANLSSLMPSAIRLARNWNPTRKSVGFELMMKNFGPAAPLATVHPTIVIVNVGCIDLDAQLCASDAQLLSLE
jgi:hypothetical protein